MNRKFQLSNNVSMYIMNSKRWLLVVLNTLTISLTYENIQFTCKISIVEAFPREMKCLDPLWLRFEKN